MAVLFGRSMVVRLGRAGGRGREITGLRMKAKIQHTNSATPSLTTVEIWNTRKNTIFEIQRPDSVVEILAGHNRSPMLVSRGNPVSGGVTEEKDGVNRVLKIEFSDGGLAYVNGYVNKSFGQGATIRTLLEECARSMGVAVGATTVDLSARLPYGFTASDKSSSILDRIAETTRSRWFSRDGVLQIVSRGKSTGEAAVLFSTSLNNIIGTPKHKAGRQIEITALLAPGIRPGNPFRVELSGVVKDYVATEVTFSLDNWQGDFHVVVFGAER